MRRALIAVSIALATVASQAWAQSGQPTPKATTTVFGKVIPGTGCSISIETPGKLDCAGSGAALADPTGSIGLSTVNGVAATATRSDGHAPLSQAIVPTWTGAHTFAQPITSTYASITALGAAIANPGTGVIPGVTNLTVVGGTGTAPVFPVTATQAVSATVAAAGDSGTPGSATVTTTTATGTQAQFTVTIADLTVATATVNNQGDGSGTPGPVTLTGVSGTGTPWQGTATIDGGGLLTGPITVTVVGDYTVGPDAEDGVTGGSLVGATADLTLAGGGIASVDAVLVAGDITSDFTDPTQEPVTGGSLVGAKLSIVEGALALGTPSPNGPLTVTPSDPVSTTGGGGGVTLAFSDGFGGVGWNYAPSILNIVAASGFGYGPNGTPSLSNTNGTALFIDDDSGFATLSFTNENSGLQMSPAMGTAGGATFFSRAFSNFGSFFSYAANGVAGAPKPTRQDDGLYQFHFYGRGTTADVRSAYIYINPEENFTNSAFGSSIAFATAKVGSASVDYRIFIDGAGNTNILNGGLLVGTPTGGSQGAGTVNVDTSYVLNGGATIRETLGAGSIGIAALTTSGATNAGSASLVGGDNGSGSAAGGGLTLGTGSAGTAGNANAGVLVASGGNAFGSGIGADITLIAGTNSDVAGTGRAGDFLLQTKRTENSGRPGILILDAEGGVSIEANYPGTLNATFGELGISKITASGTAPGAGFMKFDIVAGTLGGTCKLIAYAGTSATPTTVVDNVGAGC